mmetsp:Transcript_979/g.2523  ORF Transcript_979/g.2523 Transcript_979/m.2523 type:complete len:128 (-) Transcript_979:358-741(-)
MFVSQCRAAKRNAVFLWHGGSSVSSLETTFETVAAATTTTVMDCGPEHICFYLFIIWCSLANAEGLLLFARHFFGIELQHTHNARQRKVRSAHLIGLHGIAWHGIARCSTARGWDAVGFLGQGNTQR